MQVSAFTRRALWVTIAALAAFVLFLAYARFFSPPLAYPDRAFDPLPWAKYQPGEAPAHQVVADYIAVLDKNVGKVFVPITDLPHSPQEIRKAISSAPEWADGARSKDGMLRLGALLVTLENFVPDAGIGLPDDPSAIKGASDAWERQHHAIARLGPGYYPNLYKGARPIPIGDASRVLNEISTRTPAFVVMEIAGSLSAVLGISVLIWSALTKKPRYKLTKVRALEMFFLFTPVAIFPPLTAGGLGTVLDAATANPAVRQQGDDYIVWVSISFIFFLLLTAFDIVFRESTVRAGAATDQTVPDHRSEELEALAGLNLEKPIPEKRNNSAVIDIVIWHLIWILCFGILEQLLRGYAIPGRGKDEFTMIASGLGAFIANMYLAVGAAAGTSVGKAATGLRLVAVSGGAPCVPGFARGLVRSALQAGPWMGVLMLHSGQHDVIARTRIVSGASIDMKHLLPSETGGGFSMLQLFLAWIAHVVAAAAYAVLMVIN